MKGICYHIEKPRPETFLHHQGKRRNLQVKGADSEPGLPDQIQTPCNAINGKNAIAQDIVSLYLLLGMFDPCNGINGKNAVARDIAFFFLLRGMFDPCNGINGKNAVTQDIGGLLLTFGVYDNNALLREGYERHCYQCDSLARKPLCRYPEVLLETKKVLFMTCIWFPEHFIGITPFLEKGSVNWLFDGFPDIHSTNCTRTSDTPGELNVF